jgi:hypothetical protein
MKGSRLFSENTPENAFAIMFDPVSDNGENAFARAQTPTLAALDMFNLAMPIGVAFLWRRRAAAPETNQERGILHLG